MKVLVTGGLGFIGSNIVKRLVKEGHEVVILDNLHTGSENNISEVKNDVELVKGRSGKIRELKEKFDCIVHQGIYSSSPMYKKNRFLLSEILEDFIAILEHAKEHGSRVVFASSSSVYNGIAPPQKEDAVIHATDFYTEGRIFMERLAELYNKLYGVKVIALRYFSVYGPNEKSKGEYANLVSQFMWNIEEGNAPVIYGDGSQTRDLTYVDDVVEANFLAMKSDIGFGIFNVGTGEAISTNELIALLEKILEKKMPPKYIENPIKNYVHHTLADTEKAEKVLGFVAKTRLEDGIQKIVNKK